MSAAGDELSADYDPRPERMLDGEDPDDPSDPEVNDEAEDLLRRIRAVGIRNFYGFGGRPVVNLGLGGASGRDIYNIHDAGRDIYNAGGNINHIYNYHQAVDGATTVALPVLLDTAELIELAEVHVPTDSFAALLEKLGSGLVLLYGAPGSGRRSAAVAALHELTGRGRLGSRVAVLDPDTKPAALTTVGMQSTHGYLLDATGAGWVRHPNHELLGHVENAVRDKGAYLAVLIGDRPEGAEVNGYMVEHLPPKPGWVLDSHLRYLLGRDPADLLTSALADPSFEDRVAELRRPAEAAYLAGDIVEWALSKDELAEILPRLRDHRAVRLRSDALELLRASHKADGSPYRQAFVLAGAVLDGVPVDEVIRAAHRLASRLYEVSNPQTPPTRSVFAERLRSWLCHADVLDESGGEPWAPYARPVVRLHRPAIAGALLDVVWREFDAARDPLLDWLVELCDRPSETIRVRAAQAVGKLATHDFDAIHHAVFAAWVDSVSARHHQAAAWALECAFVDGRAAPRVLHLLRRWSNARSVYRRSVAARAYGTRIGVLHPDEALHGLRRAAADPRQQLSRAETRSMVELYAAGRRTNVLCELAAWSRGSDTMRRQSARCLLRLAALRSQELSGPRTGTEWPDLLALVRDTPEHRVPVASLWQCALTHSSTKKDAWAAMKSWVKTAGGSVSMAEALEGLLLEIATAPALSKPLGFHRKLWRHQDGADQY